MYVEMNVCIHACKHGYIYEYACIFWLYVYVYCMGCKCRWAPQTLLTRGGTTRLLPVGRCVVQVSDVTSGAVSCRGVDQVPVAQSGAGFSSRREASVSLISVMLPLDRDRSVGTAVHPNPLLLLLLSPLLLMLLMLLLLLVMMMRGPKGLR